MIHLLFVANDLHRERERERKKERERRRERARTKFYEKCVMKGECVLCLKRNHFEFVFQANFKLL